MRLLGIIIGTLTATGLFSLFLLSQQPSSRKTASSAPSSLFVCLKPGQTYLVRFDKPLPGNPKDTKTPPFEEIMPINIELVEVHSRYIRFRTQTISEALLEAERTNKEIEKVGGEPINLEFLRSEYEEGAPFGLIYFSWEPYKSPSKPGKYTDWLQLEFSIETPKRRAQAKRIKVGKQGLEIKPTLNKAGVRGFLVPEGKDKTVYVLPSDRCPAPR